ncbi:MAG: LacI family DNA-binding transcriptional regulator [Bacteroidales bacterium]|nr:LacI family DNA-binding transcriptional regulator [Bacteroidales bacterium]
MIKDTSDKGAKKKKASLKDVAQAAGVSISAVSFVMNGKQKQYRVSDELAARIKKIAKAMDYTPNGFARSLRKGTNYTIGVIVSDISNQFFADLVRNIEASAEEFGYMALFASSDENPEKMADLVEKMISKGVDGFIVVPCAGSAASVELIENRSIPFVLLDRYFPEMRTSYVALDNYKAAYDATMHLLSQGFKKVAMVSYDASLNNIKGRENGYCAAIQDAGHEVILKKVNMSAMGKTCDKAMSSILEAGADAILFATNSITIQCLEYINRHDIRIPEDLGLVGFDGGSVFDFFYAPLTYVDQPLERMARKSVEVLIESIESGHSIVQGIEMQATLVSRRSSIRR